MFDSEMVINDLEHAQSFCCEMCGAITIVGIVVPGYSDQASLVRAPKERCLHSVNIETHGGKMRAVLAVSSRCLPRLRTTIARHVVLRQAIWQSDLPSLCRGIRTA